MMESLVRSSQLLVFAALVVKASSRIPCAAHQNVDGCCTPIFSPQPETTSQPYTFPYPIPFSFPFALLQHHVPDEPLLPPYILDQGVGGGTNQPNVITQSVTWSGVKKGQKPTAAIETDCPTDEILLESSPLPKSMKFVSGNHRYQRPEYGDTEEDLDIKLKTLIRMLDNMQRREEKCDWRTCCRPRKTWKKNYWKRNDLDFEDDDYPVRETESVDDYGSDEEDEPVVRRAKTPRYQRTYDAEDVEHVEPTKRVKMVPKMDWLVLKKCPKRYPKRWMKDDVERGHDTHEAGAARDILYIPQSETGEKYRRRTVRDYTT